MNLEEIVAEARESFAKIEEIHHLDQAKARFLGKSGSITGALKGIKLLAPEDRSRAGQRVNKAKKEIEELLRARKEDLSRA